ncbi:type II toxin-antitoxin system RelE/ParE family toxin [Marinomonas piezotolerans]|nr:type II toxin-antitoxin system RelE/ParE family toxin [Marinomonas piezotolerans]
MSESFQIVASPVFKETLKKLSAFLTRKHGAVVAGDARNLIKQQVLELSHHPFSSPISERLAALGFMDYRQMLVAQHNLVFYRVDEEANKVVLIAVMDSRQSIEQLLYETMLVL